MPECIAKAKVMLTVEVDCTNTWGLNCPLSQVFEQAKVEAKSKVVNALKDVHGIKIVGEMKAYAVMAGEGK